MNISHFVISKNLSYWRIVKKLQVTRLSVVAQITRRAQIQPQATAVHGQERLILPSNE